MKTTHRPWGIVAGGSDVVITGRAADPSIYRAPLVHEFGWQLDDWDLIGTGIGVGHLLERAGQVAAGYVADPGCKDNRSYSSGRSRPMNPPP